MVRFLVSTMENRFSNLLDRDVLLRRAMVVSAVVVAVLWVIVFMRY